MKSKGYENSIVSYMSIKNIFTLELWIDMKRIYSKCKNQLAMIHFGCRCIQGLIIQNKE